MSQLVTALTDAQFDQEVLKSPVPVLVDFWAPWCGPCRMVAPIVEELAQEYTGKMKFAKINTDENIQYANQFGIRAIPTLLIFKNGGLAQRITGFQSKGQLKGVIDTVLA